VLERNEKKNFIEIGEEYNKRIHRHTAMSKINPFLSGFDLICTIRLALRLDRRHVCADAEHWTVKHSATVTGAESF
jgi:hypothetical protein